MRGARRQATAAALLGYYPHKEGRNIALEELDIDIKALEPLLEKRVQQYKNFIN